MKSILTTFFCIAITTIVLAQAGTLDSSFGRDGKATTKFNYAVSEARAIVIQPDGKIVVAGGRILYGDEFDVARYWPNGDLDTSFGRNGKVITDKEDYEGSAYAAGLQSDGKILVAGYVTHDDWNKNFALVRYNSNGTLDTNFGKRGWVSTNMGLHYDEARGMVIQADGKIILAGFNVDVHDHFAVARYDINGDLDSSFGHHGKVITTLTSNDRGTCVGVQQDGKIIVGGIADVLGYPAFGMVRYQQDGRVDSSFGINGRVVTKVHGDALYCYAMAIRPDGKIVLGGSEFHTGAVLARYEANGDLDSSFGTNGFAQTNIAFFHRILAMCLQPDNKILAAGPIPNTSTDDNFLVARYTKNGKPDKTFGSNGAAEIDFDGSSDQAYAIAFEPDGKIVVAGVASINDIRFGFGVARLNNDVNTKINQKIVDNARNVKTEKRFNIKLYPNPVIDIMNIKGLDAKQKYELCIFNVQGNLIASKKISSVSVYNWDLGMLRKGAYYLSWSTDKKKASWMFLKE